MLLRNDSNKVQISVNNKNRYIGGLINKCQLSYNISNPITLKSFYGQICNETLPYIDINHGLVIVTIHIDEVDTEVPGRNMYLNSGNCIISLKVENSNISQVVGTDFNAECKHPKWYNGNKERFLFTRQFQFMLQRGNLDSGGIGFHFTPRISCHWVIRVPEGNFLSLFLDRLQDSDADKALNRKHGIKPLEKCFCDTFKFQIVYKKQKFKWCYYFVPHNFIIPGSIQIYISGSPASTSDEEASIINRKHSYLIIHTEPWIGYNMLPLYKGIDCPDSVPSYLDPEQTVHEFIVAYDLYCYWMLKANSDKQVISIVITVIGSDKHSKVIFKARSLPRQHDAKTTAKTLMEMNSSYQYISISDTVGVTVKLFRQTNRYNIKHGNLFRFLDNLHEARRHMSRYERNNSTKIPKTVKRMRQTQPKRQEPVMNRSRVKIILKLSYLKDSGCGGPHFLKAKDNKINITCTKPNVFNSGLGTCNDITKVSWKLQAERDSFILFHILDYRQPTETSEVCIKEYNNPDMWPLYLKVNSSLTNINIVVCETISRKTFILPYTADIQVLANMAVYNQTLLSMEYYLYFEYQKLRHPGTTCNSFFIYCSL